MSKGKHDVSSANKICSNQLSNQLAIIIGYVAIVQDLLIQRFTAPFSYLATYMAIANYFTAMYVQYVAT